MAVGYFSEEILGLVSRIFFFFSTAKMYENEMNDCAGIEKLDKKTARLASSGKFTCLWGKNCRTERGAGDLTDQFELLKLPNV